MGDRVTVFTIMYYLGLGCHLRWTQAANSEALLGLNTENPRVEKRLSGEAFEFEVWDLLLWIPREVCSRGLQDIFCSTYLLP